MEFWLTQAFNGISYGALLFLLGSGLSLVFGVMRIVNLAHGSYFLLGGDGRAPTPAPARGLVPPLFFRAPPLPLLRVGNERPFLPPLTGAGPSQVLATV